MKVRSHSAIRPSVAFHLALMYAAVFAACADPAQAGTNVWTSHGPFGGRVNVLVTDQSNPQTLYAGTDFGGVFKSTNGGDNWTAMNIGINTGQSNIFVQALALNPNTPETLYAGTSSGVFKSTDVGASWMAMNSGVRPPGDHPRSRLTSLRPPYASGGSAG